MQLLLILANRRGDTKLGESFHKRLRACSRWSCSIKVSSADVKPHAGPCCRGEVAVIKLHGFWLVVWLMHMLNLHARHPQHLLLCSIAYIILRTRKNEETSTAWSINYYIDGYDQSLTLCILPRTGPRFLDRSPHSPPSQLKERLHWGFVYSRFHLSSVSRGSECQRAIHFGDCAGDCICAWSFAFANHQVNMVS